MDAPFPSLFCCFSHINLLFFLISFNDSLFLSILNLVLSHYPSFLQSSREEPSSPTRCIRHPSANRFIGWLTLFLWTPVCIKYCKTPYQRPCYAAADIIPCISKIENIFPKFSEILWQRNSSVCKISIADGRQIFYNENINIIYGGSQNG